MRFYNDTCEVDDIVSTIHWHCASHVLEKHYTVDRFDSVCLPLCLPLTDSDMPSQIASNGIVCSARFWKI